MEEADAIDQDIAQIKNALEEKNISDDCPIMVDGKDICEIAEKLDFAIGKPLKILSMEKKYPYRKEYNQMKRNKKFW